MTVEELTAAYRLQLQQLRGHLASLTTATFDQVAGADIHDASAQAFADQAAQYVAAAQTLGVQLTAAYIDQVALLEAGDVADTAVDLGAFAGARAGVSLAEVYQSPFVGLWIDLARGRAFPEALAGARAQVVRESRTDLTLSTRGAAGALVSADDRAVGWWRVASPRACSLCRTAATRLYYRGDLMPIHPGCDCTVRPAYRAETKPSSTGAIVHASYGPMFRELVAA